MYISSITDNKKSRSKILHIYIYIYIYIILKRFALITVFTGSRTDRIANEWDENPTTTELVEEIFGVECVANIMSYLRDVGMRSRNILRKAIHEEALRKHQFVIAMLASLEEIINCDYSAINQFRNILEGLGSSSDFRASQRYFRRRRICVILNAPWSDAHGEARLLDPTGEMVSEFVDKKYLRQCCTKNELQPCLEKMVACFKHEFPTENAILLIFSFHIPCTMSKFMCSNLIGEFASKARDMHIVVAYESVFRRTKRYLSRAFMNQENVYVLRIRRCAKPDRPKTKTSTWRSCCNTNWQLGDSSFHKFSEKIFTIKESRRKYRRNIGVRINTILNSSRPESYYDTWFDDRMSTIYDYCRIFNLVNKQTKGCPKERRDRKARNKRWWSNPHETFWQDY